MAPLLVEFITLFPRMVDAPLEESILGKARSKGLLQVTTRDLRPYGIGKHRVTDDTPSGGGAGMVMRPEPLVEAIEASRASLGETLRASGHEGRAHVVLLDPQGTPFRQAEARRLASHDALVFVCGRYEGVDERVRGYVDEQLSVGDFVLTGGEFAALCVVDAVARLRPGVLGNEQSPVAESFAEGLLEGPQYTRPVEFRGARVPDVLTSGDHAKVALWRRKQALARTLDKRPELVDERVKMGALGAVDLKLVRELRSEGK
jgi:tRNA (guanine37-N1)-methyltransferase